MGPLKIYASIHAPEIMTMSLLNDRGSVPTSVDFLDVPCQRAIYIDNLYSLTLDYIHKYILLLSTRP